MASEPEEEGWRSLDLWSDALTVQGNVARQLLIPAGEFSDIAEHDEELRVENRFGSWPASTVDSPLDDDQLWLELPAGSIAGEGVTSASWKCPAPMTPLSPKEVVATYRGALKLEEASEGEKVLRPPQRGADPRCPRLLDDEAGRTSNSCHADGNWQDRNDVGPLDLSTT